MPRPSKARESSEESSALSSALSEVAEAAATKTTSNGAKGTKRKRQVKTEVKEEEQKQEEQPVKKTRQRKTVKVEEEEAPVSPPKRVKRAKKTVESTEEVESTKVDGEAPTTKGTRKRKTKEEKEADSMPLAPRTTGHKLFIGAHVSSAGGVPNSVQNAIHIGANAFALFLKSQRKWANPPLDPKQSLTFHSHCEKHSFNQHKHVVPHGSYLVNLAHTDPARTKQAYDSFLDDLKRCESLGIALYNFHPGNSVGNDRPEAIAHLASNLNRAHKETSKVITLLENMAAGGNVLGSTFEDLRDIIALVEDKSRVGVCLDTCHAFAGGYDLRTPEKLNSTLSDFDNTVGLKYLRAVHLNDSKAPFDSHRDLHANIGTGFLGLRAFHAIMNDERFHGLPMVLETPIEVKDEDGKVVKDAKGKDMEDKGIWAREIKMLEGFVGMDIEGEDFAELEKKLQRMGEPERKRIAEQVEKKESKAKGKKAPVKKNKKGKKVESEDKESDGSDDE